MLLYLNHFNFGMFDKQKYLWSDGKIVDWESAQVHVSCWSLHYGVGFFEGLRAYEGKDNTYIVRLGEHVDRLFNSAKIYGIQIPYTKEEISKGIIDTVAKNKLKSCYIRPIVFLGEMKALGLNPESTQVRAAVFAIPFGHYLGADCLEKGISCKTSSWRKHSPFIVPVHSKCIGNYANVYLEKQEAQKDGYAEAIVLDERGFVCEGSAENIFMVKDGKVSTPNGASVLLGITRQCVLDICKEEGIALVERDIARDELYTADEVFLTGTAGELTPVTKIDNRVIGSGSRGPVCKKVQEIFFSAVTGKSKKHSKWVTPVY